MKRRIRVSRPDPGIALTALIDLVFLLLIYFMLASNFVEQQQFLVHLPESSHGRQTENHKTVITITSQGKVFLKRQLVKQDQLKFLLEKLADKMGSPEVEICADRLTPVHFMISVMDAAKAAGIKKIAITTVTSAPR